MPDLLAARSQMAVSLGFHIVFAVIGIAMPVLIVVVEGRWQRSGDSIYLDLAKRWAKGTAILLLPSLFYFFRICKASPADHSARLPQESEQ